MKVAIIGAGHVGSTIAYTLLVKGVVNSLSIIDINRDKAMGEAQDMRHGVAFSDQVDIKAEGYEGVRGAELIIITAGRNRKPDETRLDLAKANVRIIEDIVEQIKPHYTGSSIVVVSNPADVLTYVVYKRMGIPKHKVIGSGTTLDSARLRHLLGQAFDVDPRSIHAMVIGEHGDSAVPVWSSATVGQTPITNYIPAGRGSLTPEELAGLKQRVLSAGKHVIERKGATYYGIALSVTRIVEAILGNERSVATVASYMDGLYGISEVALSLPCVLHRDGIREVLPVSLDEEELAGLRRSADVLRDILKEVGY